jgi:uncharacterized lipoprotein YmbA
MRSYIGLALGAAVLLPLAMGACSTTPPTRFYVLSAIADQEATAPGKGPAIGIGPITLPQYLDRPEIVTRVSDNQLAVAEFDQWGGDLNDNLARTLAANMSSLLQTDRVFLFPWKDEAQIDYQVTIDVANFEQDVDGSSVLTAYWSIVDLRTSKTKLIRRSSYRDASNIAGPGTAENIGANQGGGSRPYGAVVAAMSRNVETLSHDIASAITKLKAK